MKLYKVQILLFVFILTSLVSCKAQEQKNFKTCKDIELIKELIKQELITQKDSFDNVIDHKVLNRTISKETLEIFLKPEALSMMTKIEIKSEKDIIDFTSFFNDKDFEFMHCQLNQNKINNWKQLIESSFFNSNKNRLSYSIPLFSIDKNYALIYRESIASGSLFLLKKSNEKWKHYAKQLIWID
ncbi:hypothetical protein ACOSQB_12510 [Tenacibaculum sp. MEBiC07804]|uniref:hypothetical protein n=1 Tax=unclassified Tenacibaculum TaxID=2635139 RepID=UPI003BA5BC32